jgi:8-oxo-dGTP pyrophosphatase MutT (NUDIX family)
MTLLRHIRHCNEYRPERFLPLWHDGQRVGLIRRNNAEALRRFPGIFAVTADDVRLIAGGGFADISAALDDVVEHLVSAGFLPKWRNEFFAAAPRWGARPHFKLDRSAVPFFGVRAYGVHLNGFVRDGDTLKLWVGRRAADKKVAPDKLDNLVAGGIGHDHGLAATLIKEAAEEADMPRALAARAVPVGALSYRMETDRGLRDDVLFVYDLDVPADFVPRNTDGEIVSFALMDAREVVDRVRGTDDFKFNVNLVIIDFALRHGLVTPDEPDYLDLATGLRRPID